MVMQKVRMHAKTIDDEYVQVLPETVSSQVITDLETGQTLEDMILSGTLGGGGKLSRTEFVVSVDTEGQTEFSFNEPAFDDSLDIIEVHLNGEFLHKNEEYTVVKNEGQIPKIVLIQSTSIGDKVHISVEKLTSGSGGSSSSAFTDEQNVILNSIATSPTIYVDPVNGSDSNNGTMQNPFKTAKAASAYINSKNFVNARVTIALKQGTYVNDAISVSYLNMLTITTVDGDVVFEGTPLVKSDTLFSNMFFDNIGRVIFNVPNTITVKPNPEVTMTSALYYPIYFNYVSIGFIPPSVTVDGVNSDSSKSYHGTTKMGITVGYSSNVEIRATIRNMDKPIYVVNNSSVLINQASIDQGVVQAILGSVISKAPTQALDGALPYQTDPTSIYLNQVTTGVIVESGTNENGSYIKFADGTMITKTALKKAVHVNGAHLVAEFLLPAIMVDRTYTAVPSVTLYGDNSTEQPTSTIAHNNIQTHLVTARASSLVGCAIYGTFTAEDFLYVSMIVIGRWK